MLKKGIWAGVLLAAACNTLVSAQNNKLFYNYNNGINVKVNGNDLELPWCGGVNIPQLQSADLNNDGKKDLVIYNKSNDAYQTFLNKGIAGKPVYEYAPRYERFFPGAGGYAILKDYNCDGIPDLFTRGGTGVMVYKGSYTAQNELQFTPYKPLFYPTDPTKPSSPLINVYVNANGDIPVVGDVDGDGDIDVLAYEITGGFIQFYQNMAKEKGLPCDSIVINFTSGCWGKVFQTAYRSFQGAAFSNGDPLICVNTPGYIPSMKTPTRDAGDCMCDLDYDGDGDVDMLIGNQKFDDIQLLINGTSGVNAQITKQDTLFQKNGHVLNLAKQPCGFHFDVDNDGNDDILFAPSKEDVSNNYNCISWYKKNTGTGLPYLFESDTLFTSQMIEAGSDAHPVLYDFNKDGKLDLFVGGRGVYDPVSGRYKPFIALYLNTSTAGHPEFTLSNPDFLDLKSSPGYTFEGAYPTFGDVNGDGIDDVILGKDNGTFSYYRNTAVSNNVTPAYNFVTHQLNNRNLTTVSKPTLYDVNADGKKDLVVGRSNGSLIAFINTTTNPNTVTFDSLPNLLGNVWVPAQNSLGGIAAPVVAQLDTPGKNYLLVGCADGYIYRYTDIQNNASGTYTFVDTVTQPQKLFVGSRAVPAVGDIDGDGKFDLIVGNSQGGVYLFKQDTARAWDPAPAVGIGTINMPAKAEMKVYPNPAHDQITVAFSEWNASRQRLVIMDMAGRMMLEDQWPVTVPEMTRTYSLANLPAGIYLLIVKDDHGNMQTARVVKQ